MDAKEHERWEQYYREAARRDFERQIYRRCDEEEAKEVGDDRENG